MNDSPHDKSSTPKKRVWILAITLVLSAACFLVAAWGFFGSVIAITFGISLFIPGASTQFDAHIYGGLAGGILLLALFFYFLRKLK